MRYGLSLLVTLALSVSPTIAGEICTKRGCTSTAPVATSTAVSTASGTAGGSCGTAGGSCGTAGGSSRPGLFRRVVGAVVHPFRGCRR